MLVYQRVLSLKLTAKAPENRPRSQEDMSCSSIFSGRWLVSGSKKSHCMTQVLIVVGVSPFQFLKGSRFFTVPKMVIKEKNCQEEFDCWFKSFFGDKM